MRLPAARPLLAGPYGKYALVASTASESAEPWLRGPIEGVTGLVMPLFFSFRQVREDLALHTAGLTREQLWRKIGSTSVGFHLKHIAGSIDRLTSYLLGEQLTPEQLTFLKQESHGDEELPDLLRQVKASLGDCEDRLRTLTPDALYEPRGVGRQALPTTVIGLLVHIAEHTQRHLGQAITLSQVVRQLT